MQLLVPAPRALGGNGSSCAPTEPMMVAEAACNHFWSLQEWQQQLKIGPGAQEGSSSGLQPILEPLAPIFKDY